MAMGRPRVFDRSKVAADLVEWAQKDDSINLNKFCALNKPRIAPSKLALWSKEDDEFRLACEEAKSFLAFRREEWLNNQQLHVKAYEQNACVYDYFMREEKRQQAEFDAQIHSQIIETKPPSDKEINLMDQNIKLSAENRILREGKNASESKTGKELPRSDSTI